MYFLPNTVKRLLHEIGSKASLGLQHIFGETSSTYCVHVSEGTYMVCLYYPIYTSKFHVWYVTLPQIVKHWIILHYPIEIISTIVLHMLLSF